MPEVVLYDVADRVATITINRPESRNALSTEVSRLLRELAGRADADDGVDVVILTGADPAFSAGVDLKEAASGTLDFRSADVAIGGRGPLPPLSKPVIGAINGVAVTGGFELALACDFLIASDRARFADTHARVGVQPGWGLTVLLPQAVGVRRARELSTTGNYLDAATALAWGLVNHVVPHHELLPICRALAADIVSNDRAGVQRILQTYREVSLVTAGEGWDVEGKAARDWLRAGGGTADSIAARREAIQARGKAQTRH